MKDRDKFDKCMVVSRRLDFWHTAAWTAWGFSTGLTMGLMEVFIVPCIVIAGILCITLGFISNARHRNNLDIMQASKDR
jgi:hypothetical protein